MRKLLLVVLCLFVSVPCFAKGQAVVEQAGTALDTGVILISSCAVKRSGAGAFSLTDSVFDDTTYTNTKNLKWMFKLKGPYEVMSDSCIWSDKGSYTLLYGTAPDTLPLEMPYIIEDEEKIWLNAKTSKKIYMRALLTTTGWSTGQYWITFDE
jgi:hypothetical protein